MKNEINRALMAEKKHYITPGIECQTIQSICSVCELSVFGTEKFGFGGGSDGSKATEQPF